MKQKNPKLIEIQAKLNQNFSEYAKKEFLFHLQNYLDIKPFLQERDVITSLIKDFWPTILKNSEFGQGKASIDYSFVEKLVVKYEDNFWCSVDLFLSENSFVGNSKLYKRFNVMSEEVEYMPIEWKGRTKNSLLNFFDSPEVDIDMFDTLYDIYVNGIEFFYNEKV